ncbi:hypothetical protein M3Y94_00795500 [Aphelenchoides besseyi]|nr:hypothetical protein M3Y94_00795500 [Aphelenchoides besseyi]KAI6232488.1 hypothetical protein M3Y95_00491200 [Aphelenchoides besseyi]
MRTEINGIRNAMNAIAFNDSGDAFIYDRSEQRVVRLDTSTGIYSPLRWDSSFRHKRWLCYVLFIHQEKLTVLFYKTTKQRYCLVSFQIGAKDELNFLPRSKVYLSVDSSVDQLQLSYCAQERAGNVELIFYERKATTPNEAQRFWYFVYNISALTLKREQTGFLPSSMIWELPFITSNGLHFIHRKSNGGYLATHSSDDEDQPVDWTVSDVLPDDSATVNLSRRAVWANCWKNEPFGIFVISKKQENTTKAEVWLLDVRLAAWKLCRIVM